MTGKIDALPPLRDFIRRHRLSARKSLGQNFLLDLNLAARIARAAGPLEGVTVIEIGPGPGGLTRALLAHFAGRLTIVEADAMRFDAKPYLGRGPVRVVGNLPFNIATALLVAWLSAEPWPPFYDALVLTFQREVAERIVAAPGSKQYGRLSVLAQWRTEPRILFDIAPSAFVPPPKVTSSVVRLVPRATPARCDLSVLERVTGAAFGQRRKMLRQSLKSLERDPAPLLAAAGLDPTARAEDIPVEGFVALARAFAPDM